MLAYLLSLFFSLAWRRQPPRTCSTTGCTALSQALIRAEAEEHRAPDVVDRRPLKQRSGSCITCALASETPYCAHRNAKCARLPQASFETVH